METADAGSTSLKPETNPTYSAKWLSQNFAPSTHNRMVIGQWVTAKVSKIILRIGASNEKVPISKKGLK